MENPCTFYCHSYCQRSFHEKCKDKLFPKKESESGEDQESPLNAPVTTRQQTKLPDGYWQCEDCSENTAQCFCCKNKGLILVFPKKGKPKAAGQGGSANQLESPSVMGEGNGGNDNDIEDEDLIEQQQKLQLQSNDQEDEEEKKEGNLEDNFTNQMEGNADKALDDADPNDSKYVVRCTLGGCFKYYHVKCVYMNKNVSCINSMKV